MGNWYMFAGSKVLVKELISEEAFGLVNTKTDWLIKDYEIIKDT